MAAYPAHERKPAVRSSRYALPLTNYRLVLQPHPDLYEQLLQLKQAFAQQYQCPEAVADEPTLLLLRFQQFAMSEVALQKKLQEILCHQAPFLVKLHGFGSMPTHTVFVQVATKNAIWDLLQQLQPLQPMLRLSQFNKAHFVADPYITLARNLQPWQYEKGWRQYRHTPFSGSFVASEALLLKRPPQATQYSLLARFAFAAQPVAAPPVQTLLF